MSTSKCDLISLTSSKRVTAVRMKVPVHTKEKSPFSTKNESVVPQTMIRNILRVFPKQVIYNNGLRAITFFVRQQTFVLERNSSSLLQLASDETNHFQSYTFPIEIEKQRQRPLFFDYLV